MPRVEFGGDIVVRAAVAASGRCEIAVMAAIVLRRAHLRRQPYSLRRSRRAPAPAAARPVNGIKTSIRIAGWCIGTLRILRQCSVSWSS